jgi:hypothetical protein
MYGFRYLLLSLTWKNKQNQLIDFKSNKLQTQMTPDQILSLYLWDGKNERCVYSSSSGSNTANMMNDIHTAYSGKPNRDILNLTIYLISTVFPTMIHGIQMT